MVWYISPLIQASLEEEGLTFLIASVADRVSYKAGDLRCADGMTEKVRPGTCYRWKQAEATHDPSSNASQAPCLQKAKYQGIGVFFPVKSQLWIAWSPVAGQVFQDRCNLGIREEMSLLKSLTSPEYLSQVNAKLIILKNLCLADSYSSQPQNSLSFQPVQPYEATPGKKSDLLSIQIDFSLQCWKEAYLTLGREQFVYYHPDSKAYFTRI